MLDVSAIFEQEFTTGMSDTFEVTAGIGQVIRATAQCSQTGQISGEITVTSTTTTSVPDDTSDTEPTTFTLTSQMITAIWVLTGLAIVVVVILVIVGHKTGII